jgi:hypothetical protein
VISDSTGDSCDMRDPGPVALQNPAWRATLEAASRVVQYHVAAFNCQSSRIRDTDLATTESQEFETKL